MYGGVQINLPLALSSGMFFSSTFCVDVGCVSFLLLVYSVLFTNHLFFILLFIKRELLFFSASPLALNLMWDYVTRYFPGYVHLPASRSFPEIPWRLLLLALANTLLVMYLGDFNNLRNNPSSALALISMTSSPVILFSYSLPWSYHKLWQYQYLQIQASHSWIATSYFFSAFLLVSCSNKP